MVPHLCGIVDHVTKQSFEVRRCPQCGLGKTLPHPVDLDTYYQAYYGRRHGFTARHCVKRRMSFIRKVCGSGRGRRLIDIGCGDGMQMIGARDDGWQVMGTEVNPEALRQLGLDVISDLTELPNEVMFDCITFWHSLEHLHDPLDTIRIARQHLWDNGVLLIAVPDNDGIQAELFGRYWLHLDVPRHLYHFNGDSMAALLKAAGFRPLRWWNQEFEYDVLGIAQSSLTAVMPTANVFFDALTGRSKVSRKSERLLNVAGGIVLSVLGVPVVLLSSAAKKGGTLVVAARPAQTTTPVVRG